MDAGKGYAWLPAALAPLPAGPKVFTGEDRGDSGERGDMPSCGNPDITAVPAAVGTDLAGDANSAMGSSDIRDA